MDVSARLTQLDGEAERLAAKIEAAVADRKAATTPDDKAMYKEIYDNLVAKEKQLESRRETLERHLGAGDDSHAQAAALLAPLLPDALPTDVDGIFDLAEQSHLPLLPWLCDQLSLAGPPVAALVYKSTSYLACLFSAAIDDGLKLETGGTEITDCSVYTLQLLKLLKRVNTLVPSRQRQEVEFLANSTLQSYTRGSSPLLAGTRPNIMVNMAGLLMAVGEDKLPGKVDEAIQDVRDRMSGGLPGVFYGKMPYILCYAASGPLISFGCVLANGKVQFKQPLDVRIARDAVLAVQIVMAWYRVMASQLLLAGPRDNRVAMYRDIARPAGTTIVVKPTQVEKRVQQYEVFVSEHSAGLDATNELRIVQQAALSSVGYRVGRACPFLVRSQDDPVISFTKLKQSARSSTGATETAMYSVQVAPVGRDLHDVPPDELPLLFFGILFALAMLHAAGLVHRDVRWPNVLWTLQHAFLIDLEVVSVMDQPVSHPWFRDWDVHTLDDGHYTARSDLRQAAKMLGAHPSLTDQAKLMLGRMRSEAAAAADLLSDPWFAAAASEYPYEQAINNAPSPLSASTPPSLAQLEPAEYVTWGGSKDEETEPAGKGKGRKARGDGPQLAAKGKKDKGAPAPGNGRRKVRKDAGTAAALPAAERSGRACAAAASVGCWQGHLLPPLRHPLALRACINCLEAHSAALNHRSALGACAVRRPSAFKLC